MSPQLEAVIKQAQGLSPLSVYEEELNQSFYQASITENQVNLLIVNDTTQEVEQWIPNPEQ